MGRLSDKREKERERERQAEAETNARTVSRPSERDYARQSASIICIHNNLLTKLSAYKTIIVVIIVIIIRRPFVCRHYDPLLWVSFRWARVLLWAQ